MELLALHQRVIAAIESWDPLGSSPWEHCFEELAAQVFAHQYEWNTPYRRLCTNRGISPETLKGIDQIPAVPTDAFKLTRLFGDVEPLQTFRTSGTTAQQRGAHHFRTLEVYRASLQGPFVRFCNPEQQKTRFMLLAPSRADLPESSLSFMLDELLKRWGTKKSAHYIELCDQGSWQLKKSQLQADLHEACTEETPVMMMGTAFAFAEFFEGLTGTFALPQGSRVMETGGFKGRTRSFTREELYQAFEERLQLEASHCLSEYSMTELSSQTYTRGGDRRFFAPPWLQIQIVDPLSLQPYQEVEKQGLIRFLDLANVDSVLAIQTSDRGILSADGGLTLLGRAPDAELRGCSLTIEEITTQGS